MLVFYIVDSEGKLNSAVLITRYNFINISPLVTSQILVILMSKSLNLHIPVEFVYHTNMHFFATQEVLNRQENCINSKIKLRTSISLEFVCLRNS